MRHVVIWSVMGIVVFMGACGGSTSATADSGPPPADTALALSPFAPAAIEGVINSLVATIAAQNIPSSARPPIAVLLKDTTTYWYPTIIGANRMSTRLITPFAVQAPLISDPANTTADQAAALENQYTQSYITGKLYKGLAYAPQADNADTVAYLNQFIAQCGPVVTLDSDAPDTNRSYFIATANYQAGVTAGNKLAEILKPGDTVAVFGTTLTTWPSGIQRAQGAEDALVAAGMVLAPRISPVFDATTDTNAIIAELSEPTLNIKGLVCMYSNSSDCAAAVAATGKTGLVQIVGFDMTADTKDYFNKGYFYAVAVQRQYYMGELGVLVPYAIDVLGAAQTAALLQPILVDTSFIDTGIDMITTANYADYNAFLSSLGINS
jgi:ribose transport system substrate-binding protein